MIIRLTQKLNAKIKGGPLPVLPLDPNPMGDWSARVFLAGGFQYILLSHTRTFYATLFLGKGVTSQRRFIEHSREALREFMAWDRLGAVHDRFIAPAIADVQFAAALNRSVSATMTRQVLEGEDYLAAGGSVDEVGARLNDSLFSAIDDGGPGGYGKPRAAFLELIATLRADGKS